MRADGRNAGLIRTAALAVPRIAALVALLAGPPARLAAQGKAEFTPFAGLFAPTAKVIEESCGTGCTVSLKQEATVLFGARIGVWVNERIAIEGAFGYAPSKGEFAETGVGSADTSAHVLLATGRLLLGVGPAGGNTSWHIIVGAGIVSHGGAAYDAFEAAAGEKIEGKTKGAGVVGFGGTFKLAPTLGLRLDVEDHLYSAKFRGASSGAETESKFQNDIGVTLGLAVKFGGKRM